MYIFSVQMHNQVHWQTGRQLNNQMSGWLTGNPEQQHFTTRDPVEQLASGWEPVLMHNRLATVILSPSRLVLVFPDS
jgi:hypothetical protein